MDQTSNHILSITEIAQEAISIFQNAIEGIIITDANNVIINHNYKAKEIFGFEQNEISCKPFESLISEKDQQEYLSLLNQLNKGELSPNHFYLETCGLKTDNSEINISLGVCPTNYKGARLIIYYINDITSRKEIAKALDKQKEFYENILNKLPTDIAVFDENHKYLFVNPGAISVEEYRKFIIGKDDYDYARFRNRPISSADIRRKQFLEVKNTGKEIRWEDSLPDPEGNIITHLRRMYPVHDEKGKLSLVIGFGIDITERKQMEVRQASLVELLSAQNVQLIDFCNIVSHNLRGPLVNISMLVDLIEKTSSPGKLQEYISKLKPVIENLHTTFNELVESIQVKNNTEIESEDVDLSACISRTLDGLSSEVSKSNAIFEEDLQSANHIKFPSKYLNSIIYNLLSNTLKYQSPERRLKVLIKTERQGDSIILSVKDNGLGVDLEKNRQNFFKIGKVFHRHPNSKGFGLYITKTQVEAMGGKIWLESMPDEGSTFYIEFANQRKDE